MEIILSKEADNDLDEFKKAGDISSLKKIKLLIEDIKFSAFEGIGKPEALKHSLSGKWSRKINKEDRMVYELINDTIIIYALKGHYK